VVVGGVPWTIGLIGGVKSQVGVTLTQLFDTAFQTIPSSALALPSELSYMETGVVFGSRLVKASREASINNPKGSADVVNYMRSCVFPDLQYNNLADRFQKSTDLRSVMANPNPALIVAVHVGSDIATANLVTMSCEDAYPIVEGRLDEWGEQSLRSLAAKSFPGRAIGDAITQTESSLTSYMGRARLMSASATARDAMIQNMLINAVADASALHAASIDDPAMVMLGAARAQAVSQMNASYIVQGRIAEEALPLLRNVVEAIIYALFPIVCLILIASEGQELKKAIKGYLMAMLWVELWAPCFTIVNFLRTIAGAANLGAAGTMTGAQGLSLETAAAVFGTAVSDLSVASWMVTFVPVIAGAAIFGMNQLVSAMGGGKPGSSEASSATAQTSKGNMALGNLSMGQMAVSDHVSDPFVRTQTGIGGSRATNMLTGQVIDQYAQSSNLVEFSDSGGWQRQVGEARSEALRRGRSDSLAWTQSVDAAFNQLQSLTRSGSKAVDRSTVQEVGRVASDEASKNDVWKEAQEIARAFKINDVSQVAAELSLGLGGNGRADSGNVLDPNKPPERDAKGKKIPTPKTKGGIVGVLASMAGITGKSTETEQLSLAVDRATKNVQDKQTGRKQAVVDNFRNSSGFSTLQRTDRQAADGIDASLRTAHGFQTRAAESLDHARTLEMNERKIAGFAQQGVAKWANEIAAFMRANGEDPLAGVGSTERQKQLLRQFILQGDLAGPGGSWVPDLGQGPNVPQDLGAITARGLRQDFGSIPVADSEKAVLQTNAANVGKVQKERAAAGVTPRQTIDGAPITGAVTRQQQLIADTTKADEKKLQEGYQAAHDALATRGAEVSPLHELGTGGNRAAEAAQTYRNGPVPMTVTVRDGPSPPPAPSPRPMTEAERQAAINSIPK
jgi:conjugal transfer mating pair stabilization protein TraG